MPSLRVLANPNLPQISKEEIAEISVKLQTAAARVLGIQESGIEVLWLPVLHALNPADLAVDVFYSVGEKSSLRGTLDELYNLASALKNVLLNSNLPAEYHEVSAWALPQRDAVFLSDQR